MSKRTIAALIGGFFILYGLFMTVMYFGGKSAIRKSPAYLWMEDYVRNSAIVALEIGEPGRIDPVPTSSFNQVLATGQGEVVLDVTGSKGKGRFVGLLTRERGNFDLAEARLEVEGKGEPVTVVVPASP